jgi:hypothetical protein
MGYIGAGISRFNTADELTVSGDAEFNGNANFGDSDKVSFSSGKLEMYHDGTNAYIDETYANGTFLIRGNNISLQKYTGETMIQCVSDGKVELNFNNVPKLETTSSGVDITSTATATTFQSNAGGTFTTASGNDLNIVYPDSRSLFIKEGSTTHVTVDNVGNVGIGTASVDNKLHLENAGTLYLQIENTSTANKFYVGNSGGSAILESTGAYSMNFKTNGSEAFRVDSSQNLLVGKTASGIANNGIELRANNDVLITKDGATALYLNRKSSDGEIIEFRKDGANAGEIGVVNGNNLIISNNADNSGLQLGSGSITPAYDGAGQDNSVDLGSSSTRFKHGYFANTVYTASVAGITDNDTYINFANNNIMQFITGGSEKARFAADGNLYIAKTSDTATDVGLTLSGGGFIRAVRNEICGVFNRQGSDGTLLSFSRSNSGVGAISVTTSGTTYNTTSDIRLKQDIEPLEATDKLMQMNPVSYAWKADPDGPRSMGFIAQEMADVMPEAVSTGDDDDAMMSMDYGRITPILVSALQDAHRKIEELAAEIAELKAN